MSLVDFHAFKFLSCIIYDIVDTAIILQLRYMCIDKKYVQRYLGDAIRKLRIKKGWTMEKTAFESEMEYIQFSRIELGKINTTVYQVYKLAKALNIEMSEFFIGINDSSEINIDEKKNNKIA
jgi:ribosome-binding protein aMBF1 (putative translation factor)